MIETLSLESQGLPSNDSLLIFSGQIFKKILITLQALRFKLNCHRQTCISSKSKMQLIKTIFPDSQSVVFIDKKRVENRLWEKVNFLSEKKVSFLVGGAIFEVVTYFLAEDKYEDADSTVKVTQERRLAY